MADLASLKRGKDDANPHAALKMGSYVSAAIVAVVSIPLSMTFFGGIFYSLPIVQDPFFGCGSVGFSGLPNIRASASVK